MGELEKEKSSLIKTMNSEAAAAGPGTSAGRNKGSSASSEALRERLKVCTSGGENVHVSQSYLPCLTATVVELCNLIPAFICQAACVLAGFTHKWCRHVTHTNVYAHFVSKSLCVVRYQWGLNQLYVCRHSLL